MNAFKSCLIVAVSAFTITSASAQVSNAQVHHGSTQSTGTILKGSTGLRWTSKIPLNKTYGQLSAGQKAELHKMYESLAPGDEPPFPEEGIKPIFTAIKDAQSRLQARGVLNMAVTVGPDGRAIKVENFGDVENAEMTEVTQKALLRTKYKPAMCSGSPCTMQFRFTQKLRGG
jgi:hypothetical protein